MSSAVLVRPERRTPGCRELSASDVRGMGQRLISGAVPSSEREQIDLLRALEELKSAATAAQAAIALVVDTAARRAEAREGVPADRRGRDVPLRVGMAMRESPVRARSFLGAARAWHTEMPHTLAALRAGRLSPWRATLIVKETAHLGLQERAQVDAEVCGGPGSLEGVGTAALVARVRRRAAELDPAAVAARARRAESERAVWVRPAPDTMTYVTALLPVAQGVGVYAALRAAADAGRATGDGRGRGQLMADLLVERVTGRATADAVPITVNLVMSDATLLGAGHEPAILTEHGGAGVPIPAQIARNLVANGLDADATWLRRLYADPSGRLVAATSTGRFFAGGLAAVLRVRDQGLCRTPFCDAPIRELDHVVPAADGGETAEDNGQGTCTSCNLAKERLRQRAGPSTTGPHTVITTTPTGHRYLSTAPTAPRPAAGSLLRHERRRGSPIVSPVENHLSELLGAAA
jgi:hypothetical protein